MRPTLRYAVRATRAGGGDTEFTAANPPYGAILNYFLPAAADDLRVEVLSASGKAIRTINVPANQRDAGMHRLVWDLRAEPPVAASGEGRRGGGGGRGEGGEGGGRGGATRGPQVLPGNYTVKMIGGSTTSEQTVVVQMDPEAKVSLADLHSQWDTLEQISTMMRSRSPACCVNRIATRIPPRGRSSMGHWLQAECRSSCRPCSL